VARPKKSSRTAGLRPSNNVRLPVSRATRSGCHRLTAAAPGVPRPHVRAIPRSRSTNRRAAAPAPDRSHITRAASRLDAAPTPHVPRPSLRPHRRLFRIPDMRRAAGNSRAIRLPVLLGRNSSPCASRVPVAADSVCPDARRRHTSARHAAARTACGGLRTTLRMGWASHNKKGAINGECLCRVKQASATT